MAAALFDQVEELLPQFKSSPGGPAFVSAYLFSTAIINRGPGPAAPPVEGVRTRILTKFADPEKL